MNFYFFDSSALVKRYIPEVGSNWVQSICDPQSGNKLLIARITWVEVLSAFARLQRENMVAKSDVNLAIRVFRHDINMQYQVIELDQTIAQSAGQLLQNHPLRAYDSVQLVSALKLQPAFSTITHSSLTFVSADNRLLQAAHIEGLQTENPNLYP